MPLIVKDFKWRQTESVITIQVPLHGIHQSKVDIFTSTQYVKASFEQYFFEALLLHDVKTSESKCTLTPGDIIFELEKCDNVLWEKLELDLPKSEKMELKKRLIDEEHKKFQSECSEKHDKRCELKRVAVREQISIDSKQRELINTIKTDEKQNALGDLESWRHKTEPKIIELHSDDEEEEEPKKEIIIHKPRVSTPRKPIIRRNKIPATTPAPLPRQTKVLHVDFTKRQFPTPSRESQLDEENEWLRKQAEVRRTVGFLSEDLRPEERNPQYLKAKGEEFLKAGNYLGAISAFSFGIKLCDQFPDLFIGRSEAHLKKGNYYKAAEDCSTALDLLRPAVPSNLDQRVTCISRRGTALRELGMLKQAISEMEVAVKLKPSDEEYRNALNTIKTEFKKLEDQAQKSEN